MIGTGWAGRAQVTCRHSTPRSDGLRKPAQAALGSAAGRLAALIHCSETVLAPRSSEQWLQTITEFGTDVVTSTNTRQPHSSLCRLVNTTANGQLYVVPQEFGNGPKRCRP